MEFRIADTFTSSLTKLTADEQKSVKTTAFDLQTNPTNTGLSFHKLDRAKDPNFWSVRVSRDIRIIVHRTENSLLLCYVDHHDNAYLWASRRKLETHPKTGAAQFVEIRETVKEITVPVYVEEEKPLPPKPPLFADVSDEDLLSYGVPVDWLDAVREVNEDTLLEIADRLPNEAAEALLSLATGETPVVNTVPDGTNPFDHPDAQRRFRLMHNMEELKTALDYPWEKWTVFLHPAQQELIERDINGPARVSGSAGTGKTIVALHRAVYLAKKYPDSRVLLTTFSDILANALRAKLRRLISNEPIIGERLEVHSINEIGLRLYKTHFETPKIATKEQIKVWLNEASKNVEENKFSPHFLITEWEDIVNAWQLDSWEEYRDVARLGRKTRLPEKQRTILWIIFESVKTKLKENGLITYSQLFTQLAEKLSTLKNPPYEFAVIDEAQDVSVPQLKFLASLGNDRPNALFFAGDLGQRIYQQPFSWKSLGVDIRGRSKTLRINYRTSHQIRMQADRLLDPELSDVDGNTEKRKGTISVFNGPKPEIRILESIDQEVLTVQNWIKERLVDNIKPHEIGIFVRSESEISRAQSVFDGSDIKFKNLDGQVDTTSGYISIGTMDLAKGLEFRIVVAMACDDEIIPLQERIETVSDDSDLEEVYNTERHLLYVACTRARDQLLVTCIDPPSEFVEDMKI